MVQQTISVIALKDILAPKTAFISVRSEIFAELAQKLAYVWPCPADTSASVLEKVNSSDIFNL